LQLARGEEYPRRIPNKIPPTMSKRSGSAAMVAALW